MPDQFETGVIVEMLDIALGTGKEIVDTNDLMALPQQSVDEMGTNESSASGNENAFAAIVKSGQNISFPSINENGLYEPVR